MSIREKIIHSLILGFLFSFINWILVDKFIINLSFWKYFFIEIILVISLKLYTFIKLKLKLN
jgi:hypothetical protein